MARFSAQDLALYSRFERLGIEPPPEAAALIARRKAGASTEELEAYVRQAFPQDARTRLAAIEWIREGTPPVQANPTGDTGPSRLRLKSGSLERRP
jgi:hypothetical protein